MSKEKLTGLERQDAYVKEMEGQDFDFGLVMTQAFLKGIRDIGYKSTATAMFESFDNSIQAGASNIQVLFEFDKGSAGKSEPKRIAIVDDGHGMSPEMVRFAVLWGGSDRIDDRGGMGKYGYGLPSSCVSIGESFTVISKREDNPAWQGVTIDIQKIAKRDPEYMDPTSGRIVAPPARIMEIPGFVNKVYDKKNLILNHGTIVIIDKIDRLSFKQFARLKDFLITQTGVTYRNYLRATNISIDEVLVEPIDPLFTTEGFRYYDIDEDRAIALPPLSIKVKDMGTVRARFSLMPPTFLRVPEDKLKQKGGKHNPRFEIRKENNGIIVTRAGRQIDVINSKCKWTTFQNNDRYIGIELDFPPALDEFFSITTAKQQIVILDNLWDILRDSGVYEAISELRTLFHKELKNLAARTAKQNATGEDDEINLVEKIMQDSAKEFEIDIDVQPSHVKREAEDELNKEVKKKAKEIGIGEDIIKVALEEESKNRPFKIDFIEEDEGPFYRPKQIGGQIIIYINKAHRFYTDLYENSKTSPFMKNALALLLFSFGHSELRVTEDRRKFYQQERQYAWSQKLQTTLEKLSEHFDKSPDDQVHEEEMGFAEENTKK